MDILQIVLESRGEALKIIIRRDSPSSFETQFGHHSENSLKFRDGIAYLKIILNMWRQVSIHTGCEASGDHPGHRHHFVRERHLRETEISRQLADPDLMLCVAAS